MSSESLIGTVAPFGATRGAADIDPGRRVREHIQNAIVDHRLAPGTKLSEEEVGEAFGVSRTVVRAALQSLSHHGLVSLERNRGAFVAQPSADEARQVFNARRLIEPDLARAAAERFTAKDAKRLREHTAQEAAAIKAGDRRTAIRLSGGLHLEIAALAGNEILARFLGELVARSSLIIALYGKTGISACGLNDHKDIIAALAKKDGKRAALLMVEHLHHIDHDLDLTRGPSAPRALSDLLDL
ncbi:GntR family transcriptional regulator [Terrihabitans soli]|uniref:GntR family transcriptional regulator n=1 Tax=Terrihabitans soli TaxID=708113 RepID=A0A6S6QY86_9HYPH|nr:GntR family transcriptional regulator [Terrihabitans soli]BCJ92232.1 GntR family transcriptional regulator [Terrihabitans soli]